MPNLNIPVVTGLNVHSSAVAYTILFGIQLSVFSHCCVVSDLFHFNFCTLYQYYHRSSYYTSIYRYLPAYNLSKILLNSLLVAVCVVCFGMYGTLAVK